MAELKLNSPSEGHKPKGAHGRAAVKQLGRTKTTGNFKKIEAAKGKGADSRISERAQGAWRKPQRAPRAPGHEWLALRRTRGARSYLGREALLHARRLPKVSERDHERKPHTLAGRPGNATIAWGHKVLPTEVFSAQITEAMAETLFDGDSAIAAQAVKRLVTVEISQGIFDALVDFTFNEGPARLETSTLLKLLNAGQPAQACRELFHSDGDGHIGGWVFAAGEIQPGLVARRQAEQQLWNA
jgi:lysozyme